MPMESQWSEYVDFACRLADAAATVTVPLFRVPIEVIDKSADGSAKIDPVTEADRRAEEVMRAMISETYPDHGILGEELGGKQGQGPLTWVIDPIDGTRSFISGIPLWATLIALNESGRVMLGVMDQPVLGERFIGGPGGAWLNGNGIAVRSCPGLADAVLYTTDPDMFATPGERDAYRTLEREVALRRFGGDCYAYCMLALGFVDLVVEGDLKPYDIQALIPIIEGAGGLVTAWDGGAAEGGGLVVAAGDARVHAEAVTILSAGLNRSRTS